VTTTDAHALANLLSYTDWSPETSRDTARDVVAALADMGARATPALVALLGAPRRGRVGRMAAAWLLGRLPGAEATAALERAARDRDPDVAGAARRALSARQPEPVPSAA
jgi:HEAT repeat protein